MSFISGDYREVIRKEIEQHERYIQRQNRLKQSEELEHEEEETDDTEETVTLQTFPTVHSNVIRQDASDLTCGMRCLQNMYGQHIVSREEMDNEAKELEKRSFGVQMYNKDLGFYNIEVLKAVLIRKGKHVQRIDHEKIPSQYFHRAMMLNPTFTGYIVAIGIENVNHYLAVRCRQNSIRVVDSLPNVAPLNVEPEDLFCSSQDHNIHVHPGSQHPVIAIMAVAGGPFIEYTLMHDTWPANDLPNVESYLRAVSVNERRPNAKTFQKMRDSVWKAIQSHANIIVKMEDQQAVIRCNDVSQIITDLLQRQWIQQDKTFFLKQNERTLDIDLESSGPLGSFNVDTDRPLYLVHETYVPNQAQVGGFYRFNCDVEGQCIGAQHKSYSVRDQDGNVHVVYKNTISNLKRLRKE